MNLMKSFVLLYIISIAFSMDMNFSLESKYGDGENDDNDFNESILDINTYFDNGLYFYSQFGKDFNLMQN